MKIHQISAGRERSVALAANGSAYGWGAFKTLRPTPQGAFADAVCSTDNSEVGHNRYAQPAPQILNPQQPFTAIADGYVDTLAIHSSGSMVSCLPLVAPQGGALHQAIGGMPGSAVQAALTAAAAFALHADGSVWSWGMNNNGQLGRPTPVLHSAAGAIAGLPPIAALAAGGSHLLALDRKGRVWAWGANSAGQLGDGSLSTRSLPFAIELAEPIKQIAAGDTHSFAVGVSGRLWAWGANNHGQTGDSAARHYTRPVQVKTGFPVAQLDAGMFYTAALAAQGEVFAWGWNGLGQLGSEHATSSPRPLRIKALANITRIAAGTGHVLATDGSAVFAWGDNRSAACASAATRAIQPQPTAVIFA